MKDSSRPSPSPAAPEGRLDSLMTGASDLASSAAEKLQAVRDIWKTVATTNETFQKAIESDQSVAKDFFSTLNDAVKSAETAEERERYLRMGQETVRDAQAASNNLSDKALEIGKGAIIVLGVIAAGAAAIMYAQNKKD